MLTFLLLTIAADPEPPRFTVTNRMPAFVVTNKMPAPAVAAPRPFMGTTRATGVVPVGVPNSLSPDPVQYRVLTGTNVYAVTPGFIEACTSYG